MTCLSAAAIARAATTGEVDDHVEDCLTCRRRLALERDAQKAAQRLPVPALPAARRRALAAEILAIAEREPPVRRRPWRAAATAIAGAAAMAAAIALSTWWPGRTAELAVPRPVASAPEELAIATSSVAHIEAPPVPAAPRIEASGGARLSQRVGGARDVVTLVEGVVEIDTRSARDVDVHVGDSVVRVDDATVRIRAHQHAIVSVQVVLGAARVTSPEQHVTLQRDSLWFPGPPAKERSLAAFQDAWIALRAGHNREAIALFDRATDPVVAEEATYWAAIAARRSGDRTLAAERIADFLRRFPRSVYAAEIADAPP